MKTLGSSTQILNYQNKVLYANTENGKWIRVSKGVSDIISLYLESSDDFEERCNFENNDDKELIFKIIDRMCVNGIMQEEGKLSKVEKTIAIEITNNCNLRCKHCCVNAGEENDYEFSNEELKSILVKCIEWEPDSINLSGGEPLMRKDFFDILSFLRSRYNGSITLSTNGLLINEGNVDEICRSVNKIDISIDGVNEETCAAIRGKGVFSKVISCIHLLHEHDFDNISLSMVFSPSNEMYEKEFYELNERLGTHALPRIIADIGRAKKYINEFMNNVNEAYVPMSFLKEEKVGDISFCSCGAGRKTIFIRHDGSVYPCPSFMKDKYKMGNIKNVDSLFMITAQNIDDTVKKQMLKANMIFSEKCSDCPVKYFCWSCIGDTDRFPTAESLDKYCSITKPILMKKVWACS